MPNIDAKTRVCGIFGHPVGHSLSPAIHNAAFEYLGLPYVYVAHDVLPEALPAAMAGIRALGYRGLSVTIPHKVSAMALVDEVHPTARAIGCINTVVNDDGVLRGYNSDGRGALGALVRAGADPSGGEVVILGSGGAARALAMTLALESAPTRISLLGVAPEELATLGKDVAASGKSEVTMDALEPAALARRLEGATHLLHCTPIGMHPRVEQSVVPASLLRPGLTVFDAVYNPRRTLLLQDAARAGCRVVEGLEMFLGQALVQFELWTGQPAPQQVMRDVLEARL